MGCSDAKAVLNSVKELQKDISHKVIALIESDSKN